MAWLAVDKDGTECMHATEPYRGRDEFYAEGNVVELPKGTIKKFLDYPLTWENNPVEI